MNKSSPLTILVIILLVGCLSGIASDIYTPSVPAISQFMGVSLHWVQMTMAVFMVGLAGSQLIYGPVSDMVGRKSPLLIGLAIMMLGSLLSIYAQDIHTLLAARFVQG